MRAREPGTADTDRGPLSGVFRDLMRMSMASPRQAAQRRLAQQVNGGPRAARLAEVAKLLDARRDPASALPVQRVLTVGAETYGPDDHHTRKRDLINQLHHAVHSLGFVWTNGANTEIHRLINEGDQPPYPSVRELITQLFERELFYRPAVGVQYGPRTLGERPNFTGEANQIPPQPGMARRHVISSSSLGLAIERSLGGQPGKQGAVIDFLERNGVASQDLAPPGEANLRAACRRAWVLTHNHVGNLWMGPTVPNSVRGFIRGTFAAEVDPIVQMLEQDPAARIGAAAVNDIVGRLAVPRGPGMQRAGATEHWQRIVADVRATLETNLPQAGLPAGAVANILREFQENADLDLPQVDDNTVRAPDNVIQIFLGLKLAAPNVDIFGAGQPLDAFLKVDVNAQAQ